jgi:hypothetical protein
VIDGASGSARSDGGGGLRAGPASLEGLAWLARVGPAPVEAWACAMGWGRSAAFSHAQRLEREGWVVRYPMLRGQGTLLVASRLGVRMAGVAISPARPPTPTWWAHLRACGWVAAWLTVRGRVMQGCRQVEADPSWRGDLRWHDSNGAHRSGHRPDLAVILEGVRFGVEVELARKSVERLTAIVGLHARWRAAGQTGGVIYVCADEAGAERVRDIAAGRGMSTGRGGGLRLELLEMIEREALAAAASAAEDRAHPATAVDG